MTTPPTLFDGYEAIDGQGNLWAQFSPGSGLYIWTPAQLLQSCASMMPAIGLTASTGAIAFDSKGNLWTVNTSGHIEGYRSTDLKASYDGGPSWVVSGDCGAPNLLCGPTALAFDSNGYLWTANPDSVLAFAPATLVADHHADAGFQNTPADLTLTSEAELDAGSRPYADYVFNAVAFDANGNLWVTVWDYQDNPVTHEILAFTRAQLQNLDRDETPTAAETVKETAGQEQEGFLGWVTLAFDVDGNLWAGALSPPGPNLFRFSAASLKNGLPDITLTVPGDPSISLAFSPIPPGLPIRP